MKQTAVEWFWDEIADILPFTVDTETGMALYEAHQKAKEMEKWQRMKFDIPELSDEEIEEAWGLIETKYVDEWVSFKLMFIEGANWYREQLKQRQ